MGAKAREDEPLRDWPETVVGGKYVRQFLLPSTSPFFSALKGMFIRTGPNGTDPTIYWIESGNLMRAPLGIGPLASPSKQSPW